MNTENDPYEHEHPPHHPREEGTRQGNLCLFLICSRMSQHRRPIWSMNSYVRTPTYLFYTRLRQASNLLFNFCFVDRAIEVAELRPAKAQAKGRRYICIRTLPDRRSVLQTNPGLSPSRRRDRRRHGDRRSRHVYCEPRHVEAGGVLYRDVLAQLRVSRDGRLGNDVGKTAGV
jgi:hypothetical protein